MMIQRWQSVWLLLASICVALFCFMPMALLSFEGAVPADGASASFLSPADNTVFLIVGIVVAVLLVLDIFMYRNTRRQKQVTVLSMLMIAVLAACGVLMVYGVEHEGAKVEWMGSILLLLGAFIFSLLAYRGIRHDENLLKTADRLR